LVITKMNNPVRSAVFASIFSALTVLGTPVCAEQPAWVEAEKAAMESEQWKKQQEMAREQGKAEQEIERERAKALEEQAKESSR